MLNKVWESAPEALEDLGDGATVMIGGFAEAGKPNSLLLALRDRASRTSRSSPMESAGAMRTRIS